MDSFATIISLWPSASELARDLGLKDVTVRAWRTRGIPGVYWVAVVGAADARGFNNVTVERLAAIAASSRAPTPPMEAA